MSSDAAAVVIVGAGPAGMRAAITLAHAGITPILVDEAPSPGGQIFRTPPSAIRRTPHELYGAQARRYLTLKAAFEACSERIAYHPSTLVWDIEDDELLTVSKRATGRIRWGRLILATGAMDRIIPVRGWTQPGIYSLGGAQTALKAQGCAIGSEVVFLGTGPLLYLVAYQYAKAGVNVRGVLDTSSMRPGVSAWLGLLRGGQTLLQGTYYLSALKLRGIPLFSGIAPLEFAVREGGDIEVVFRDRRGAVRSVRGSAVGFGFGLKAETQLADLLGLAFEFNSQHQQWLPTVDRHRRSSRQRVYLAGDGTAPQGVELAEVSGELAARTLLHDLGSKEGEARRQGLMRTLDRAQSFRRALDEKLFALPRDLSGDVPDDVVVCRCEGINAGAIRQTAREAGANEINRLKAFTRLGMGRCQGRLCGAPASAILAAACGQPLSSVGRLRGQAPTKPLPLSVLAGSDT
jgi:hydrogen cyanide synthase HcnB